MEGTIIKILSEKCYVKILKEVVICGLPGKFRLQKLLPLVGDKVIINEKKQIIDRILPRRNVLRRPNVCNITQGLIVASLKHPDLDTTLLDKILVELEYHHIKPIICFTKADLLSKDEMADIEDIVSYYGSLYPIYYNNEIDKLKKLFKNEITVLVGQSGSGKSTLINRLEPSLSLKTGEISEALGRGKHTTRHAEMLELFDGMLVDTPGFSALEFSNMKQEEIRDAFIEFMKYPCLYRDCMHLNEQDCCVKEAVANGKIKKFRYDDYVNFMKDGQKLDYQRRGER